MNTEKKGLRPENLSDAMAALNAWRQNSGSAVHCPLCGEPGLAVEDHSTRPYAEWYAMTCSSCGFDDTLHIPGATPGRSVR